MFLTAVVLVQVTRDAADRLHWSAEHGTDEVVLNLNNEGPKNARRISSLENCMLSSSRVEWGSKLVFL